MQSAGAESKPLEEPRVAAPPAVVEVRRRSSGGNQTHVDVEPVPDAGHVGQKTPVLGWRARRG